MKTDDEMGNETERLSRRDRGYLPTTGADNKTPVGKLTRDGGAGGAAWAMRSKILALRAEGNAASKQGVALLVRLITRPDDIFAVEAFLATGVIERNPKAAGSTRCSPR